jgi:hypothetical protein
MKNNIDDIIDVMRRDNVNILFTSQGENLLSGRLYNDGIHNTFIPFSKEILIVLKFLKHIIDKIKKKTK